MFTINPWKYPDWIYTIKRKLNGIDLTRFPSDCWLKYKIIPPHKNKYHPQWAISVKTYMSVKDRIDGKKLTIVNDNDGLYLYNDRQCEQIVYAELERMIKHELQECFRVYDLEGKTYTIVFDPHAKKITHIANSAYNKVEFLRYYPSEFVALQIGFNQWLETFNNSFHNSITLWEDKKQWWKLWSTLFGISLIIFCNLYVVIDMLHYLLNK